MPEPLKSRWYDTIVLLIAVLFMSIVPCTILYIATNK